MCDSYHVEFIFKTFGKVPSSYLCQCVLNTDPMISTTPPHWPHSYKMATYVSLYSLWDSSKFCNHVLTNEQMNAQKNEL